MLDFAALVSINFPTDEYRQQQTTMNNSDNNLKYLFTAMCMLIISGNFILQLVKNQGRMKQIALSL
jgi:hypothetical protein